VQPFELISFPSDEALATAVAERWLDQLSAVVWNDGPYCVAFSGGRISRKFFTAVAECAGTRTVSLSKIHFFWADERCVPPTDAESNFALAWNLLLAPLKVPLDRIHRIRGESIPDLAAAEAEAAIRRIAPVNGSGQPVLNLVFLGMGEDGHVASLFPGAPAELLNTKAVYLPVIAAKPPPMRITMNYSTVAAASEVWVLASGAGKEEALRKSLSSQGTTPLARAIQGRERTVIFSDIRISSMA
jgi:6-phosphogluconolactonase